MVFPGRVRRSRLLKPLRDIITFFPTRVIQQDDRPVSYCTSRVSFEKEAETAFSAKHTLLKEISEGGVRPFGGLWKQYYPFSQRKIWPSNDSYVYSSQCNNICHNSPAKSSGRAMEWTGFLNVTQVIGLSHNSFWH